MKSHLSNLKEISQLLSLSSQAQNEIVLILEDFESRLKSLEEDRRKLISLSLEKDQKISSLEKRYSELLYRLSCK